MCFDRADQTPSSWCAPSAVGPERSSVSRWTPGAAPAIRPSSGRDRAAEQRRRLRSGIEHYAAVLLDRRQRIDILRGHALVARLPALAVIRAEKYAVAMGAGEKPVPPGTIASVVACTPASMVRRTPTSAGCIALQHADATGGGDQEPARRLRAVVAIETIGTQASKHRCGPREQKRVTEYQIGKDQSAGIANKIGSITPNTTSSHSCRLSFRRALVSMFSARPPTL